MIRELEYYRQRMKGLGRGETALVELHNRTLELVRHTRDISSLDSCERRELMARLGGFLEALALFTAEEPSAWKAHFVEICREEEKTLP